VRIKIHNILQLKKKTWHLTWYVATHGSPDTTTPPVKSEECNGSNKHSSQSEHISFHSSAKPSSYSSEQNSKYHHGVGVGVSHAMGSTLLDEAKALKKQADGLKKTDDLTGHLELYFRSSIMFLECASEEANTPPQKSINISYSAVAGMFGYIAQQAKNYADKLSR
jgi:hypothetical protein